MVSGRLTLSLSPDYEELVKGGHWTRSQSRASILLSPDWKEP